MAGDVEAVLGLLDTDILQGIRKLKYERAFFVDPVYGEVIWQGLGTEQAVGVPDAERLANTVMIHNHPNSDGLDNSFSGADLGTTYDLKLRAIVAVTLNWVHVLARPAGGSWSVLGIPKKLITEMDKRARSCPTEKEMAALAELMGGTYAKVPLDALLGGANFVAPSEGPARIVCLN